MDFSASLRTADDVVVILPTSSPDSLRVYTLHERPSPSELGSPDSPAQESLPGFDLKTITCAAASVPEDVRSRFLLRELPPHLGRDAAVDVVVSTGSGARSAASAWDGALKALLGEVDSSIGVPSGADRYTVVRTQSAASVREYSRRLWRNASGRTVILLSGDGGIVDLLNGRESPAGFAAPDTAPTVCLLPFGTANALFHSLHKPLCSSASGVAPLVLALRSLFFGKSAPLPTFRVEFSPGARLVDAAAETPGALGDPVSGLDGAIVASYGLHAGIVWESDTPEYRRFGVKRFAMVAGALLKESHAYEARVGVVRSACGEMAVLGERDSDRHAYVLATMVSNLERTFTISPDSAPLDGKLRLLRFGPVGGERAMEIMKAAYREGEHVRMRWKRRRMTTTTEGGAEAVVEEEDGVDYEEVCEARIEVRDEDARWRKVCVDGTIVEIEKGGWMVVKTVEKPMLRVVVDEGVLAA